MFRKLKDIGPGAMVAAAFIGPGTVTTATFAGSGFGYTLLWAVLFSVIATLILQEMAARLGSVGQLGLGEALRFKINAPVIRLGASLLVIAAVLVGNSAFEAGNITGAALGFNAPTGSVTYLILILSIGLLAFLLLWTGSYRLIERSMVVLVGLMGFVFPIAAFLLKPAFSEMMHGLFYPGLPDGSLVMVVSLIGTTVVPYNLFLHASAAKTRWSIDSLPQARMDTLLSVLIGGFITMAIVVTSAIAFKGTPTEVDSIKDLGFQLEPLLGNWSSGFLSIGFFAAGLSSAITAPLAASYAVSEVMGWSTNLKAPRFRGIWVIVLLTGVVLSCFGLKPTMVILFAQFANGILLPLLAILLLWIMNEKRILGNNINTPWINVLGIMVILVTILLGVKSMITAL